MATRKPLYFDAVTGFQTEMPATDEIALGGLAMSGDITMATKKITGLGDGSAAADAVNKSQLDAVASSAKTWKELLLVKEQVLDGAAGGVCQAMPIYIDTNPQANDTFLLKNTGLTETYTFKVAEGAAFDVEIGIDAATTLINLIAAINDDSAEWSAIATAALDKDFAAEPTAQAVIYRTTADEDDDRMYSTVAVTSVIKVVEFATGDQNYEIDSGTESTLPAADPAAKRFGFSRAFADITQNETHITIEDNATWTWDSDDELWQQSDAGAIVAGAGLSKTSQTLNVGDVNKGVQANADDLEIDASEIAGDGLEQNGVNSYVLDVEADVVSGANIQPANITGDGVGLDVNAIAGTSLEADGSANLRIAAAAAGDGLTGGGAAALAASVKEGIEIDADAIRVKIASANELSQGAGGLAVVGVPASFKIGATATTGAKVTAANVDALCDGSEVDSATPLHVHQAAPKHSYVTGDALVAGDPAYISGNDILSKADASIDAKAKVAGISETAIASPGPAVIVSAGPARAVLVGATAGDTYWLATGGGISTAIPGVGLRLVQVGEALNATDLFVQIRDFGKRAA